MATGGEATARRRRADAQRNVDALLGAAKTVFAASGVDAPAKVISDLAGVGVGTLYRHFPQRSDLVIAVLDREIGACADAAAALSAEHDPMTALATWLQRYTELVATKQGLASALHSNEPAFEALRSSFTERMGPALGSLLEAAAAAGEVRSDVSAKDLLYAVPKLCVPVEDEGPGYGARMVALLVDGLRYGTSPTGGRAAGRGPSASRS